MLSIINLQHMHGNYVHFSNFLEGLSLIFLLKIIVTKSYDLESLVDTAQQRSVKDL